MICKLGEQMGASCSPTLDGTVSVVWQYLHEQERHEDFRWSLYHALTWLAQQLWTTLTYDPQNVDFRSPKEKLWQIARL